MPQCNAVTPFRPRCFVLIAGAVIPLLPTGNGRAQEAEPAWRRRGNAVEEHRRALQQRMADVRRSLSDSLTAYAPALLPKLDPAPPPVPQGYALLPKIVPDVVTEIQAPRISVYHWPWTDTLIAQGEARLDSVTLMLSRDAKTVAAYDTIVARFNAVVAQRRLADSHVEHNWFWQREVARDTSRYRRVEAEIMQRVAPGDTGGSPAVPAPVVEMRLDSTRRRILVVHIPVVTDIADTAFLRDAKAAIESIWTVSTAQRTYRLSVDWQRVDPRTLYCAKASAGCTAPATGSIIDVTAHLARFPSGRAVLTTGATQPYVTGSRAILLGPRDATPRTLAHEFGHILGYPDSYLRGSRDLGADGFAVLELSPDPRDIMSSAGSGGVLRRHFEQLAITLEADHSMKAGLDAMYQARQPARAAQWFRHTLRLRPTHYGATFQLAKALDAAGDSTAATDVWKRVLTMANSYNDAATAAMARARIGKR